jgi:hypothetical protein
MIRSVGIVWRTGGLATALVLAVLLMGGFAAAAPTYAPAAASHSEVVSPESIPNGNLSVSAPQPQGQLVPGSTLVSQYSVSVVSNLTDLPSVLTVWVPQTITVFYFPSQTLRVVGAAQTVNFSSQGPFTSRPINGTDLVKFGGPFNSSSNALLTSQLLSFMYNAPSGAFALSVSWRWAISYPDGSSVFGPWSQSPRLLGAEYAPLLSYGPTTIAPQGWFQVCLAPSAQNREYSLHLETISPVDDFIQVERNISATGGGPVCWSAQVAPWVTPQPLLAHVWAYDEETFLLYLIKITVANQTGALGVLFSTVSTWNGAVTVGALGVAGGLVVWGAVRAGSRPRRPNSKDSGNPPP